VRRAPGAEVDRHDRAGGRLAYQVVEEDAARHGSGVDLAAAARAVRARVDGAEVAAPEVQEAEAGDDAEVAGFGDYVGREAVTAGPLRVVAVGAALSGLMMISSLPISDKDPTTERPFMSHLPESVQVPEAVLPRL
jgi:hypothetical protein